MSFSCKTEKYLAFKFLSNLKELKFELYPDIISFIFLTTNDQKKENYYNSIKNFYIHSL